MNRRQFITSSSTVFRMPSALLGSLGCRRKSAPDSNANGNPLPEPIARAFAMGKPLVVLLGPDEPERERGEAFYSDLQGFHHYSNAAGKDHSDLFCYADEAFWVAASLAHFHVSAHNVWRRIQQSVPGAASLPDSAWALVVEPQTDTKANLVNTTALSLPLADRPWRNWETSVETLNAQLRDRIAPRFQDLTEILSGNNLAARAKASRLALGPQLAQEVLAQVDSLEESRETKHSALEEAKPVLDRGSALVLAERPESNRGPKLLKQIARDRLWEQDLSGGAWTEPFGCSMNFLFQRIKPTSHFACGMGHTPEASKRFLLYYAPKA